MRKISNISTRDVVGAVPYGFVCSHFVIKTVYKYKCGRTECSPTKIVRSHFAIKTAMCRVAKRGFCCTCATKTFAPSASEVKAHDLRGIYLYQHD